MKNEINIQETLADVAVRFRELNEHLEKRSAELDREFEKSRADFDRRMKKAEAAREKSDADFDRRMKEVEAAREKAAADFDRRMKRQEELVGSWGNNHGSFAEEYFYNSFEQGKQNFFGEEFDDIEKGMKGYKKNYKDEYDIVLFNGKSIAIVEVKYKAHDRDIPKVIKKAETFRVNYPDFKNHKIFLGLASMAFYPELEEECENEGIAVIKQTGDKVIINHEHLKAY